MLKLIGIFINSFLTIIALIGTLLLSETLFYGILLGLLLIVSGFFLFELKQQGWKWSSIKSRKCKISILLKSLLLTAILISSSLSVITNFPAKAPQLIHKYLSDDIKKVLAIDVTESEQIWGPDRPIYVSENPPPIATINSITNNPLIGDERDFFRCSQLGRGNFEEKIE